MAWFLPIVAIHAFRLSVLISGTVKSEGFKIHFLNHTTASEGDCMTLTETLPAKGIYTLIVFFPKEARLKVGKLGTKRFPAGYYAYTGSALGTGSSSLKQRVTRHLHKGKQKFWHIDFLLAHENATVTSVIAAHTDGKAECDMNVSIKKKLRAKTPVMGFGASDCEQNCGSHLLYLGDKNIKSQVAMLYADKLRARPFVLDFAKKLACLDVPLQKPQISSNPRIK